MDLSFEWVESSMLIPLFSIVIMVKLTLRGLFFNIMKLKIVNFKNFSYKKRTSFSTEVLFLI
ncbi:hypothetical protein EMIT0210MI2_12652 [Priestia megaterium]